MEGIVNFPRSTAKFPIPVESIESAASEVIGRSWTRMAAVSLLWHRNLVNRHLEGVNLLTICFVIERLPESGPRIETMESRLLFREIKKFTEP
jgi:hypothetical protein